MAHDEASRTKDQDDAPPTSSAPGRVSLQAFQLEHPEKKMNDRLRVIQPSMDVHTVIGWRVTIIYFEMPRPGTLIATIASCDLTGDETHGYHVRFGFQGSPEFALGTLRALTAVISGKNDMIGWSITFLKENGLRQTVAPIRVEF